MPTDSVPLKMVSLPSVGPMLFSLTGIGLERGRQGAGAENGDQLLDSLDREAAGNLAAGRGWPRCRFGAEANLAVEDDGQLGA